jgi:hypothetical protein
MLPVIPTTNVRFFALYNTIEMQQNAGDAEAARDMNLLLKMIDRYFGFLEENVDAHLKQEIIDNEDAILENESEKARVGINKLANKYNTDIVFLPGISYHPLPAAEIRRFQLEEKENPVPV